MALSEKQMLMLNNLIYRKEFSMKENEGRQIGEILEEIQESDLPTGEPTSREEWKQIIELAKSDQEICKLYLIDTMDNKKTGGRAMCVADDDPKSGVSEETNAIVVFAGTGKNEWRDNAVAGTETDTPLQVEAYEWVENLDSHLKNITVSGHSKGGNKAIYTAVRSDRVGECYAYDGEGVSQEFVDKYDAQTKKKKNKIHLRCNYRDYVNILLICIAGDVVYYKNKGGTDSEEAMGFGGYHCPDMMFKHDEDGNIIYEMAESDADSQDWTMSFMHELVIYLMEHAPKGEQVLALSVLGELLQQLVGGASAEVKQEILDKYGKDGFEILLKYLIAFMRKYQKEHPLEFRLNMNALYLLLIEFFGMKGAVASQILYAALKSGSFDLLYTVLYYTYNLAGGSGTIIRDFSQSTRERLFSMAKEVEEEPWWNVFRWDCWYRMENRMGLLNIDYYADNINSYYRKLIDINDASCKDIEKIFDKVYEIDNHCGADLSNIREKLHTVRDELRSLAEGIS